METHSLHSGRYLLFSVILSNFRIPANFVRIVEMVEISMETYIITENWKRIAFESVIGHGLHNALIELRAET